jgi:spore coat polysaccharide biosynthesis predicted glycosyltransferase SpsG
VPARRQRILVRIDDTHVIGRGHVVRTSAMLGMLDMPCELIVAGEGEGLQGWFPGASVMPVSQGAIGDVADIASRFAVDLFLCDHPAAPEQIWQRVRYRPDLPCVAIDDKGGHVDADLIINGTVIEELQRYVELREGAVVLTGSRHTLVRKEFSDRVWQEPERRSVTIVVGSGDRAAEWALWLTSGKLDMSGWGAVTMVTGAAFPRSDALRQRCTALGIALRQSLSAMQMAEALAGATVALTTGGMIVYECVVTGVPAVIFPQEKNLVEECAWFDAQGCAVSLGHDGGFSGETVAGAVAALLGDQARRSAQSATARLTMDGRGMERAARAISGMLQRQTARA